MNESAADARLRIVEQDVAVIRSDFQYLKQTLERHIEDTKKHQDRQAAQVTWISRLFLGAVILAFTNFMLRGELVGAVSNAIQ